MKFCRGIDVSGNNPRQNWAAHKEAGVDFAFIKASEGNHTRDTRFSAHMSDVKAAKIRVVGGYHFAWPNESVQENAANYIGAVRKFAGPGFVHWLDLEPYEDRRNYTGCTSAGIRAWVDAWVRAVERAFPGQRVGVYGNAAENSHIAVQLPRWFAAYPWPPGKATYAMAAAHTLSVGTAGNVKFWQFSGSPLDRSIFYGTADELAAWAGGGSSSPAAPKPPPKPQPPATRPRSIKVKAGMTLSGIAIILGFSVTALAHYNHISNPDHIVPGQVISAPPVAPKPPAKPPAKPKPAPRPPLPYTVHTVKSGETLSGIAKAAGVKDWHTLASYNHLAHPDRIVPGQVIRIPKAK